MHCVAYRFGYPNYRLSELSLVPISSDNRRSTVPCNQICTETTHASELNPLNAELNPICHLLAVLEGATIVDVSGLMVNHLFQIQTL